MQMERGGYLKSTHLVARCIWLNINILQGSPANYVGTEPIFVSNVELYRFKHLIINTLHSILLLQGKLGLWVRAPSGSLEQMVKRRKPLIINHYQRFFFISHLHFGAKWGNKNRWNRWTWFPPEQSPPICIILLWFSVFCKLATTW